MKKLLCIYLLLASSASLYAAEKISSVSFNPSRMGEYTYLKVADKATLRGGLRTPQMNVSVGGTVSVYPDSSSRMYIVNQVLGQQSSAIDMQQAAFHGNSMNTYTGYQSETDSTPSGLLNKMEIYGGNQLYVNDSYIRTMDAVNMLIQHAGTLKSDNLAVLGSNGGTMSLYNGDDTYGFYLAGNDIPQPTASHTNTGQALSNCTLVWEKRKTSDSPSQEVWLLALKDCNTSGSESDEEDEEEESYTWQYAFDNIQVSNTVAGGSSSSAPCPSTLNSNDSRAPGSISGCPSSPNGKECTRKGSFCFTTDYCQLYSLYAYTTIYTCK